MCAAPFVCVVSTCRRKVSRPRPYLLMFCKANYVYTIVIKPLLKVRVTYFASNVCCGAACSRALPALALAPLRPPCLGPLNVRGNHLSNITCLTKVFFKCGEQCSKFLRSLRRRSTRKTNEAVLDTWRQTSSATQLLGPAGVSAWRRTYLLTARARGREKSNIPKFPK